MSSNIDKINKELAQLKKVFGKVLEKDPLSVLTQTEKDVLFRTREHYKSFPLGLPMFLRSV